MLKAIHASLQRILCYKMCILTCTAGVSPGFEHLHLGQNIADEKKISTFRLKTYRLLLVGESPGVQVGIKKS